MRASIIVGMSLAFATGSAWAQALTPMEELGKALFFDADLSTPPGQSCAACHAPEVGFTGPDSWSNEHGSVYHGAVHTRFGNRKPPSAAYGGYSPNLHYDDEEGVWVGGMFWDGRASGWRLGDPLAEQAQGPFLNPLEQNNPNARHVLIKVRNADYAQLYEEVFGEPVNIHDVNTAYERVARAISAYEQSPEVNPFSSKYDAYLAGEAELTDQETLGLALFEGAAMCSACHPSQPGPNGEPPLFTDFTFDNLGVPRNGENPFYAMPKPWNPVGSAWIDPGLGGFLAGTAYADHAAANWGKHKVPSLRNVDLRPSVDFVKAFAHNGFFDSLEEIVHFYNTRDVEPWPMPEVAENVNSDELGDLGLSAEDEEALVAFLRTLSDGWSSPAVLNSVASGVDRLALTGPNPFNPSTWLELELDIAGSVDVALYNLAGQRLGTLLAGAQAAGRHPILVEADDLPSGTYFILARTSQGDMVEKVVLLR